MNNCYYLITFFTILSFVCENSEIWGYTFTVMKTDADYLGEVKSAKVYATFKPAHYDA